MFAYTISNVLECLNYELLCAFNMLKCLNMDDVLEICLEQVRLNLSMFGSCLVEFHASDMHWVIV